MSADVLADVPRSNTSFLWSTQPPPHTPPPPSRALLPYRYTANILIAVNPYQQLGVYGPEAIQQYAGASLRMHAPHVYALANRAFMSMKSSKKNQSMVW